MLWKPKPQPPIRGERKLVVTGGDLLTLWFLSPGEPAPGLRRGLPGRPGSGAEARSAGGGLAARRGAPRWKKKKNE